MNKKNFVGLVFLTILIVLAGTLAYYASTINGELTTRSKSFAFNVYKIINTNEEVFSDINLYDTAKVHNGVGNVIVPGDYGEFIIKLNSNGSEVKLRYDVILSGNNIPSNMKFYLDSEKIDKVELNPLSLNGILDIDEEREYTIYWQWPYDSGENNYDDINYQNMTFTIGVDITGKQAKDTEYAINYIGFNNSAQYPSVIDMNDELTIDMSNYNYTSLSLKQGDNDLSLDTHYTYNDGILILHNIEDDVTITNLTSFCSMYRINNLKDCLIATDYPNYRKDKSLTNAINNIESKVADFTKVEPYLTYSENKQYHITDKVYKTNKLTSELYYYGTSVSAINTETANYTIQGGTSGVYASIEEIKNNGWYTCLSVNSSCNIVYKIYDYAVVNDKVELTDYDKYTYSLNDYTSKAGLYAIEDENNTNSYYYRGEVNNNWVSFGGFYWRILRINGDGSIRLIYSGTKDKHTGSTTGIGSIPINTKRYGATYVGYMYNDDDMEIASYPNTNPSKVTGYNIFNNIGATTEYYFVKNFDKDTDCSTSTKTCTLTCNLGTDCVKSTWSGLYNNYDKNDSSSTYNEWKYTGEYKYTCFGYGTLSDNKITCPIVSEIKGVRTTTKKVDGVTTYIPNSTQARVLYHGLFSPSYESAVSNVKDSDIKRKIDTWYETNILNKNLESYLTNQIFCNDRSISSGDGYTLNSTTLYNPYYRMNTSHRPSLICQNNNDKFTLKVVGESSIAGIEGYGNNALKYPVGLMTIDEAALAGGVYGRMNNKYYLYNGLYNWTSSPSCFDSSYALSNVWRVFSAGNLTYTNSATSYAVRPVVNLKSDTLLTSGSGTGMDPYVIE